MKTNLRGTLIASSSCKNNNENKSQGHTHLLVAAVQSSGSTLLLREVSSEAITNSSYVANKTTTSILRGTDSLQTLQNLTQLRTVIGTLPLVRIYQPGGAVSDKVPCQLEQVIPMVVRNELLPDNLASKYIEILHRQNLDCPHEAQSPVQGCVWIHINSEWNFICFCPLCCSILISPDHSDYPTPHFLEGGRVTGDHPKVIDSWSSSKMSDKDQEREGTTLED